MDLVTGQVCEVACAELRWEDGHNYYVPFVDH